MEPANGSAAAKPDSALEVRQLRAFLALVDHGSVSAAALALGLAQSTVSEALAALERAVGAPIVLRRRGAQPTALTAAGEALLPDLDELAHAVLGERGERELPGA